VPSLSLRPPKAGLVSRRSFCCALMPAESWRSWRD